MNDFLHIYQSKFIVSFMGIFMYVDFDMYMDIFDKIEIIPNVLK